MNGIKSPMILAIIILIAACTNETKTDKSPMRPDAPVAEKADTILNEHGTTRVDPYFWMRLTDEQKKAEKSDTHAQKVLNYLNEENAYTKKVLSHTEELQSNLYDEIVGRIKQTDESVPYFSNGLVLYTL
jgi:oligopeptidase B